MLTTKKQTKYELDIFLPYMINQQNACVTFNTVSKVSKSNLELRICISFIFYNRKLTDFRNPIFLLLSHFFSQLSLIMLYSLSFIVLN